jgi:hypothetical protein
MEGSISVFTDQGVGKETASSNASIGAIWYDKSILSVDVQPEGKTWESHDTPDLSYSYGPWMWIISNSYGTHTSKYRFVLQSGYCLKGHLSQFVREPHQHRYSESPLDLVLYARGYGRNEKNRTPISVGVIDLISGTANILKDKFRYKSVRLNIFERSSKAPIERTRINYTISINGNLDEDIEISKAFTEIFQPIFPSPLQGVKNPQDYLRDAIIKKILEEYKPLYSLLSFNRSGITKSFTGGKSVDFDLFEVGSASQNEVMLTVQIQAENYKPFEITVPLAHDAHLVDIYLNDAYSEYRTSSKKQIVVH